MGNNCWITINSRGRNKWRSNEQYNIKLLQNNNKISISPAKLYVYILSLFNSYHSFAFYYTFSFRSFFKVIFIGFNATNVEFKDLQADPTPNNFPFRIGS